MSKVNHMDEKFKKIKGHAQTIQERERTILAAIKEENIGSETLANDRNLYGSLQIWANRYEGKKVEAFTYYEDIVESAIKMSAIVKEINLATASEIGGLSDKDAYRRKANWTDWLHRTVRWTLGAVAAVLFYSTVVWASEKVEFIKVPINHTLIEAAGQPGPTPGHPPQSPQD